MNVFDCICIQKNQLESETEQHKREIDQQKRVNDQQKRENDQLKQEIDLQKREIDRLQNNIHGQQPTKQAQPKQPTKPSAKKVGYKKEPLCTYNKYSNVLYHLYFQSM